MRASPPSWSNSVESRRTRVDLPEPFWPRMATHSPRAISKLTPRSASTARGGGAGRSACRRCGGTPCASFELLLRARAAPDSTCRDTETARLLLSRWRAQKPESAEAQHRGVQVSCGAGRAQGRLSASPAAAEHELDTRAPRAAAARPRFLPDHAATGRRERTRRMRPTAQPRARISRVRAAASCRRRAGRCTAEPPPEEAERAAAAVAAGRARRPRRSRRGARSRDAAPSR